MEFQDSFRLVFAVMMSGDAALVFLPEEWEARMTTPFLADQNFTGAVPDVPGVYRATAYAYRDDSGEAPRWEFCLDEIEAVAIDW